MTSQSSFFRAFVNRRAALAMVCLISLWANSGRAQEAPKPQSAQNVVKVFSLSRLQASEAARILQQVLGGKTIRIAVDERTNAIIATGREDELSTVEALLLRLDESAGVADRRPDAQPSLQLRIIWLSNGVPAESRPAPPPDLKEVLTELDKIGVNRLSMVGQIVVKTVAGQQFQTQCSPAVDTPVELQIEGTTEVLGDRVKLTLDVQAAEAPQDDKKGGNTASRRRELFRLRSTIAARAGHYVVVGVTPVGKSTSAIVVQVNDATTR